MSALPPTNPPATPTASEDQPTAAATPRSVRGRWKIGLGIFAIACGAQSILWKMWWEDPTHFKMSILFVWPGALFLLLIWWTFFSGWSAKVRYGTVAFGFALLVAFFSVFRLERFDGDMTPTRLTYRWVPSADEKAREFLKQAAETTPVANVTEEPLVVTENDWPGYRGVGRDGIIRDFALRADLATNPPKEIWRHPVGRGWSSFAVVGDFAFTQEQRDDSEAVVAYRFSDGKQIWTHLDKARFAASDAQGGTGPRATPQFHEGKLYTLGATGILNCLEARTGKLIWTKNILQDAGTGGKPAANIEWGMAGSPLIVDQMVVVNPGGPGGHSAAAYNVESGELIWSGGDQPATYASPSLATLLGQRVILVPDGTGLACHSPTHGKELWFFPWTNAPKVCGALPVVVGEDSVLFGIGYGEGTVRLKLTLDGENWSATKQWHSNRFRPKFNDFIVRDGHAYGLDDGTLTCLDIESGKVKWKAGRYGYGQVLLVGETLLLVSEEGQLVLIPAQPTKPEEPARAPLLDGGITWNQPVLVRGKLLVRNAHEAACFDLE